jgi:hypothetical protein
MAFGRAARNWRAIGCVLALVAAGLLLATASTSAQKSAPNSSEIPKVPGRLRYSFD